MLLYSTCSILHQENADQICQFIDNHDDAELDQNAVYPWISSDESTQSGCQIIPGQLNMDGFYYALLRRKESISDDL